MALRTRVHRSPDEHTAGSASAERKPRHGGLFRVDGDPRGGRPHYRVAYTSDCRTTSGMSGARSVMATNPWASRSPRAASKRAVQVLHFEDALPHSPPVQQVEALQDLQLRALDIDLEQVRFPAVPAVEARSFGVLEQVLEHGVALVAAQLRDVRGPHPRDVQPPAPGLGMLPHHGMLGGHLDDVRELQHVDGGETFSLAV